MKIPDYPPPTSPGSAILAPFWQWADAGELRLPACSLCGAWQWYPLGALGCHPEAELDWRSVAHTGRVFTFTRVHRCLLPEHADQPPYMPALVELDGVEGPRLVTLLVGIPEGTDPGIGMRVKLRLLPRSYGKLPAFEPL